MIPSRVERSDAGGVRLWRPGGTVRLICLPPAGGSSASFQPLVRHLPEDWSVVAIDPPGHGGFAGVPLPDVSAMADAAALILGPADQPVFLLGHSLGSMVALRLAQAGRLRLNGLILCGLAPPSRIAGVRAVTDIHASDEAILSGLDRLGGVPAVVMEDLEFARLFVPPLRADLAAFAAEAEEWTNGRFAGLPAVPTLVVAGQEDPLAPPQFLRDWAAFSAQVRTEVVAGGHFFPQQNAPALARLLMSFARSGRE